MYEAHCGLDKLVMTWGHDEYMYQVSMAFLAVSETSRKKEFEFPSSGLVFQCV